MAGKINVRVSNQLWRPGVPTGGTVGQHLQKASSTDYDLEWTSLSDVFAEAGANTNITSLSGLTTPLSVAQGGTGVTTLAAYNTILVPAGAMISATTNPAESGTYEYGTNDQDFDYFAFDSGVTEERIMFPVVMPDNWDGSTIKALFMWTSATGSSVADTVEWGIKGVAIGDNDPLDVAQGTPQVISDSVLAANGADLQITSATPSITIGGTGSGGELVNFEVYRNTDGTDDMAEDAWLLMVYLQYSTDSNQAAW